MITIGARHMEYPKTVANKLAEAYFSVAYADKYYNGDKKAIPNRDKVIADITQLIKTAYAKLSDNMAVLVDNAVYNDLKRQRRI